MTLAFEPPEFLNRSALTLIASCLNLVDNGKGVPYPLAEHIVCATAESFHDLIVSRGFPSWYAEGIALRIADAGADFIVLGLATGRITT